MQLYLRAATCAIVRFACTALTVAALPACASETAEESWGWHGQATYVWQAKPAFTAPYDGPNSLGGQRERSYSFTATLAAGWRPWRGGELYFNPELVQGVPLSGLTGLGGLSNGELQKTAGSNPVLYRARAFLRQSWALGDETEAVESGFNQLAGTRATHRLVLSVGNLAASDIFDDNGLAHDARSQFLNWALLTHGHYDFAADSRGYSQGLALEWIGGDWALRGGRFEVPIESNGLALDSHLRTRFGDQIEIEHRHQIAGRGGVLRLLGFRNVARMARFDEALAAAGPGAVPQLDAVRRLQAKQGWGLSGEQSLAQDVDIFARAGRHDGATEPYSFASIDDSASAGMIWRGSSWSRPADRVGVALASNGLSPAHRRFLVAGGSDFFLGDGRLHYGRENILEAFYSAALGDKLWLSADLQHIRNPAYNRDRGPVRFLALRLHAEL